MSLDTNVLGGGFLSRFSNKYINMTGNSELNRYFSIYSVSTFMKNLQ